MNGNFEESEEVVFLVHGVFWMGGVEVQAESELGLAPIMGGLNTARRVSWFRVRDDKRVGFVSKKNQFRNFNPPKKERKRFLTYRLSTPRFFFSLYIAAAAPFNS